MRFLRSSFVVLVVLISTSGLARASKTVIRTKGMDAGGSFDIQQTRTCSPGVTGTDTISVHVGMFETTLTTDGTGATVLQAAMNVTRVDGCTSDVLFDFGMFEGVGTLTMTALQTGNVTGHFVLPQGTTLDLNLTMTGSDTTSTGTTARRTILGKTMLIQRGTGTSRTATLSGTAVIDGTTFSSSQMTNTDASLARNTGGEITILKP